MYELIQVGSQSYYVDCPAKIGVVKIGENEVCLIDSGNNKEAAKKIKKILDANNWTLRAVFNTHSHADHIGGNAYLQAQTDCRIYARGIEQDFTRHPILEPAFLYGGFPSADLRHKFLLAQESAVEELTEDVLPTGWQMLPLPGHSFDMVGFRTPDDVVYTADSVASRDTLEKYGIPFLYDIDAHLQTLEALKSTSASLFIPSHAPAVDDITALVQYNIDHIRHIADTITALCAEPRTFEGLLQDLFDTYALTMTFEQYALVGSTVRSLLAFLKNSERLTVSFDRNAMLWSAV